MADSDGNCTVPTVAINACISSLEESVAKLVKKTDGIDSLDIGDELKDLLKISVNMRGLVDGKEQANEASEANEAMRELNDKEFDKLLNEVTSIGKDDESNHESDIFNEDNQSENGSENGRDNEWDDDYLWKAFYEIMEWYAKTRTLMVSDVIAVLQPKSKLQYKLAPNHGITQTIFEDLMMEMHQHSDENAKYIAYEKVDHKLFQQFWKAKKFEPKYLFKYVGNKEKNMKPIASEDETNAFIDAFYKVQKVWLCIGITLTWWSKKPYNDSSDESENNEFRDYYKEHKEYINVNYQSGGYNNGTSIVHECVENRNARGLRLALEFGVDLSLKFAGKYSFESNRGKTAIEMAKDQQLWDIYEMLLFAKVGNKMRDQMENRREMIELKRGMVKQFLKHFDCHDPKSKEYESIMSIMDCLLGMIKKRLPFSDDLLLLLYHFELDIMKETSKNGKVDPLCTRVWQALTQVCDSVLRIPQNRKDWLWFKSYLLPSSIWHQESDSIEIKELKEKMINESKKNDDTTMTTTTTSTKEATSDGKKEEEKEESKAGDAGNAGERGELLYERLCEMVDNQLTAQVDYLKSYINQLENEKDNDAWNSIKNYKEYIACDETIGVRQDSMIDTETGKEIMDYPNEASFTYEHLKGLSDQVNDFAFEHHYDVNGYLSKLIINAHTINNKFHSQMRNIFGLPDAYENKNSKNVWNSDKTLLYMEGSVKTKTRCVSKAESDYADKKFPVTASICDFVRCSLVFESASSMLDAMKQFEEQVASNETELVKIVRIKNMFLENKRENGNAWDLYRYADLKYNVLWSDATSGISMVVEVQFLFDFMRHAKGLGHGLYEIERQKEFMLDLQEIMDIGKDKHNELLSAITRGNEAHMARLLITNDGFVDLKDFTLWENVLKHGWSKLLKLLISAVPQDDLKTYLNLCGEGGYTILMQAVAYQHMDCIKELLRYVANGTLDINATTEAGSTAFLQAVAANKTEIISELLTCPSVDPFIEEKNGNSAIFEAFKQVNFDLVRTMFDKLGDNIDVNKQNSNGETLLMMVANLGYDYNESTRCSLIKYLMKHGKVDPNLTNKDGESALSLAAASNAKEIVSLLLNSFDNIELGLAFVESCNCDDEEIPAQLLKRFPDLDVNKVGRWGMNGLLYAGDNRSSNKVLEWLLTLPNIDANITNDSGTSVLGIRLRRTDYRDDWKPAVDAFAKLLPDYDPSKGGVLQGAIGAFLHRRNPDHDTALEMITYILDKFPNMDINNQTADSGDTPLHTAASFERVTVTEHLLTCKNINPNVANEKGQTAIMIAARCGSLGCFTKLLDDTRTDWSIKDKESKHLLHYIASTQAAPRMDAMKKMLFDKQKELGKNVFSEKDWQQIQQENEKNDEK